MSSYLQIISCETADSSPSILVATENERFLFNSGDGSQRLCCEHRVRLAKMENVFLTHVGADATGGLPGMLLTIADIGRRALRLHGPPGIGRFMHATRHFMRRPDFAVTCVEGVESLCTKQLSVHKILVEGGPSSSPTHKRPRSSSTLSPTRKGLQSFMCYIAEVPPSPGRFLVDRAKELGVPQGPLYGKLKSGCSVTLGDGRVVKPESVVAPAVPGCAAAIIACPSVDLVDAMTSHPGWAEWLEGGAHCKSKSRLSVMAHFASSDVVHSDAYLRWCAQWGEGITHLFLGRGLCGGHTPYVASLSSSLKLHRLCPQIFPIPQQHGGNSKQHSTVFSKVSAAPLSRYWMAPHHKIGLDESASLDAARVQSAASDRADQDWKDAACVGQSDFESATSAVTDPSKSCMRSDQLGAEHPLGKTEGAELAFLGTGSSQPSKYRNVSGIYLKLGLGHAGMLLDAGEGSMGQLWRLFGSDDGGAKDVLTGLQAVWISHPHADHHLGLVRVLTERLRLGLDPLILMAPLCVHRWLEEYAELDPLVSGTYRWVLAD
jgi:ribonuclease Z